MSSQRRTVTVREPGLLTTVQDLGRLGHLRFGVTTGGALDQASLTLGNQLVGNEPAAAGLEMTLLGPRLRFDDDAVIAVTGGGMSPRLNGAPVPAWAALPVAAGDVLTFAPTAAGARAYLAVAGGFDVPVVLGGRGTDLFGHLGGLEGRALAAGDVLSLGEAAAPLADLAGRVSRVLPPPLGGDALLRVVLGPQANRFTDAALETLVSSTYTVTPQADRMGIRLQGPVLAHSHGADAISEGIHPGSIQVPGDGQPILLTRARQTVGGYPKVATVISADLDRLGQLRPGDRVTFTAVSVEEARAIGATYRAGLTDAVEGADDGGVTALEGGRETMASESWTPAAVAALVAALPAADVSLLRLELPGGFRLEIRRGAETTIAGTDASFDADPHTAPARVGTATATDGSGDGATIRVTAPLLGVFYRRPAPDQPPFADVGAAVDAGDRLGLIEVMKTYHEVTAPAAGRVAAFLAPDGEFVEFGQPVVLLMPLD